MNIGGSLFDEAGAAKVESILEKAKQKNVKIHIGEDFVCAEKYAADAEHAVYTREQGVPEGWMGLDIGPQTIAEFQEVIGRAKTIIWNGPAGVYEWEAFQTGTKSILEAVAGSTKKGALSVIGGGDCGACAVQWGYDKQLSHISTGGGASLQLLEGGDMPGLLALSDKSSLNLATRAVSGTEVETGSASKCCNLL